MASIEQVYTYKASAEQVYTALTKEEHFKQWWTPDCKIEGDIARFEFNPYGDYCVMYITHLEPGKQVQWACEDAVMMGTKDWNGTTLTFDLKPTPEGGTELAFKHAGWQEKTNCYERCTQGWQRFLGESLKSYLETGKGKPFKPE